MTLIHRLPAVLLALALVVGNVGMCPGWEATPEARMACCTKNDRCPMRDARAKDSDSGKRITQSQADSCCASSEREESDTSNTAGLVAISSAVLGDGVIIPASIPALVLSEHWRTIVPLPVAPVARHVLHSVFLV